MNSSQKIRIGVVFGGRSGEHEVSLISAQSILKALDPEKYDVIPIGISKIGTWLVGIDPQKFLPDHTSSKKICQDSKTGLLGDPSHKGLVLLDQTHPMEKVKLDVVFPVVHGTNGEDGTLQGMLELADIPYVGCGVLASSVGMDKTSMKRVFRDAGLPVADFKEYLRKDWRGNSQKILGDVEAHFGYPCFVKPVNSGSSVGISKAHNRDELSKAFDLASKFDRKILVEAFVDGRELEVSVLGNDEPEASLPGEIVPCNEFYDYKAKYIDERSELHIPAKICDEKISEIKDLAVRAFKAIDGAGMARVDFFLETSTNRLILNEINTIPGFTGVSMYPKLWEASGLKYSELVDRLVQLAFERYSDKQESLQTVA
ncbi:D-alanine--D-alanine ligase [bacterium]|nr:D-alanine--D-alanine ligase [bacterium]